jgi:hypothetical protein
VEHLGAHDASGTFAMTPTDPCPKCAHAFCRKPAVGQAAWGSQTLQVCNEHGVFLIEVAQRFGLQPEATPLREWSMAAEVSP